MLFVKQEPLDKVKAIGTTGLLLNLCLVARFLVEEPEGYPRLWTVVLQAAPALAPRPPQDLFAGGRD